MVSLFVATLWAGLSQQVRWKSACPRSQDERQHETTDGEVMPAFVQSAPSNTVLHHLSLFIGYFWNHVRHRIKTDPEDVDVTSVSSVVATGLIFMASPLLLILFSYSVFFCYELRFRTWKRFQPQCDFPTKSNTFIEPRRRLFIRWKFKKFDFAFIKGRKTSYFRIDKKTIIFKLS